MKPLNFILRTDTLDAVFMTDEFEQNGIEQVINELSEERQLIVSKYRELIISKMPMGMFLEYCVAQIDYTQHYSEERLIIFTNISDSYILLISQFSEEELLIYNNCKSLVLSLIINE